MRLRNCAAAALVVLPVVLSIALAQNAIDPALQGSWVVVGAEHGGKPMEGLTGGTMTITGDRFEIHTAGGSLLKGTLQVNRAAKPATMGLLHDSGLRWQAIYEATANDFRLNYIDAAGT